MDANAKTQIKKRKNSIQGTKKNLMYTNKIYMLPIIFIIAILPFIVRLHEYDTGLSIFSWFNDNDTKIDVFLYCKQIFFIIIASSMFLLILYKVFHDKMHYRLPITLLPLLLYGLLAFLSTVFSDYSSFGFSGIYEQFESIFVILGYCLIVFYAYIFVKSEEDLKFIFRYLLISILLMGLLGLSQAIGHDFIASDLASRLIIPAKFIGKIGLNFNFGPNRVYLSLYNPNYVGVYVSLIIPILIGLLLTEKKKSKIILYVMALIGMLICLIYSKSKTGIISLIIALILTIYFFRKYLFRKSKAIKTTVSLIVTAIILITVFKFNIILSSFNHLFNIQKVTHSLTDIKTEEDLTFTYNGNDLIVHLNTDDSGITVNMKDSDNYIIPYTITEAGGFIINDKRFEDIHLAPTIYNNVICLKVSIDGKLWVFTNQTGDNTFYYLNGMGEFDKINTVYSSLFNGYEKFASSRGYIWSRTIPLLKEHLFLGSGADTFAIAFPQQDYVNLYYAGFDGQLVTRPHNMFLQMGVQTGVISLLAFLVFYGVYFFSSIKLYWKGEFKHFYSQAGVSIFIGTFVYMIAGITNDSTITVAPIFWVLLGLGFAINYKLNSNFKTDK